MGRVITTIASARIRLLKGDYYQSGVPGDFCTSVKETNWYERSLEWHEERSTHRSRS